jgi:hypothetical protein
MISDDKFEAAADLANQIIEFADCDDDGIASFACLMAAATYSVSHGAEIGQAARVLKIFMQQYAKDNKEEFND